MNFFICLYTTLQKYFWPFFGSKHVFVIKTVKLSQNHIGLKIVLTHFKVWANMYCNIRLQIRLVPSLLNTCNDKNLNRMLILMIK